MRPPLRHRRPGTSLMEVLIAIFIMALGLMALLTLFPLGLLTMAAAIKDDQCARAAANADGTARFFWKGIWEDVPPGGIANTSNPNLNNMPQLDAAGITALLDTHGRVFIDPYGMIGNPSGTAQQLLVGGNRYPPNPVQPQGPPAMQVGTPRSSVGVRTGTNTAFVLGTEGYPYSVTRRFCTLLDDIYFDRQGQPDANNLSLISPGSVRRDGRYNFAWLLTRQPGQPRYEANLKVVVYGGLKGARSFSTPAAETPYTAMFTVGSTSAQLLYDTSLGQTKPNLGRNSWIYDNQNGYFYRVVDISEDQLSATQFQVNLELQTPALANTGAPPPATASFVAGAGVVMELIAEVFDTGTLSPSSVPMLQP